MMERGKGTSLSPPGGRLEALKGAVNAKTGQAEQAKQCQAWSRSMLLQEPSRKLMQGTRTQGGSLQYNLLLC